MKNDEQRRIVAYLDGLDLTLPFGAHILMEREMESMDANNFHVK